MRKGVMFLSSKKYLYNLSKEDELLYVDDISYLLVKGGDTFSITAGTSSTTTKSINTSSTCILFSHGNGGNITYYDGHITMLKKYGDVLIYDYPGYGKSLGTSTEEFVLESGIKMCTYILNNLPYEKIILYGFSLGGAVTVHIASIINSPKIVGVILQSTFANMKDCVQILEKKISLGKYFVKEFRSLEKVSDIKYPICVLHSKKDGVVPYSSSRELYELINTPKIFYDLGDTGHNDYILDKTYAVDNSFKFLEACHKFSFLKNYNSYSS